MAYAPTSVVSTDPNLQHIADVVYHEKEAIENLKANIAYPALFDRKKLPKNSGKTIRFFSYNKFAANTTPAPEGVIGTGKAPATVTTDATIAQYYDFMSFSDVVKDVAIDDTIGNAAKEFGYQAALTVNELCKAQVETQADADATSNIDLDGTAGTVEYMTGSTARQARFSLEGNDVPPPSGGWYAGLTHPFVAYDMMNDNSAGGIMDILKRNDFSALQRGVQGYRLIKLDGIEWVVSTLVDTTANYDSSGLTGYHSYVVGKEAFFMISLGATEIPKDKNFKLMVERFPGTPTQADPAGIIGAVVSYKFYFAASDRPDDESCFRRIRSLASIT